MKSNNNINQKLKINKKSNLIKAALVFILFIGVQEANAQIEKLAGPRIGMTVITPGSFADAVNDGVFNFELFDQKKYGHSGAAFTTQFGWQWESRFGNENGSFIGLVEWVALVGGLEKGRFLPSFSAIVGARTASGFEFGMGPNISLGGVGLVLGVGKNFKIGELNVPANLVFIPGVKKQGSITRTNANNEYFEERYTYSTGSRISLMFGFNMSKSKPKARFN